jgi:subtilase family serine protease
VRLRILSAAVLLSLVVVSLATRGGTAEPLPVPDTLHAQAAAQGSVRVIVRLNAPFVPEGQLATPAHVLSQRQMLAGAQSMVRGQLRGVQHRVVRDFGGTLPLMALEASPDALRMLASLRGIVTDVQKDELSAPGLADSIPLINADDVWAAGYDGSDQIVAILDTGVQKTHPFFGGRVIAEACFSSNSASSTTVCPGNVETSFAPGSGVNCPVAGSGCKHGTHVAGIAAGSSASFSGVAKGARIIAIQVFSRFPASYPSCGGVECVLSFSTDQIAAMQYVDAQRQIFPGRRIAAVNMSLGGGQNISTCPGDSRALVIDQLRTPHQSDPTDPGVATVISSGNNGFTSSISAPACNPSAIPVASSTKSDAISSFSNMASTSTFPNLLLAPGSLINSSVPPSTFAIFSGTSMSAPHVTGTFAVLRQVAPTATVDQILTALKSTGTPITDTRPGGSFSAPRIDVLAAALQLGQPNLVVQTLAAPTVTFPGTNISVSTSVRNTGVDPVGASNLQLYLSTDDVITTGDTPLGNVIAFNALGGGNTSPVATRLVQIPPGTTPGTYYIGAIADVDGQVAEGNENDNTKAVQIQIVLPDLTVPSVTFTPALSGPGANMTVTHTVRNVAPSPANAPASTSGIYLGVSQSFGSVIGGPLALVSVPAVAAGATSPAITTTNVGIPGSTPPGPYYVIVRANDASAFPEGPGDNVGASATTILVGADLIVTAATATPLATAPGMTVSVSNTIKNQGGAPAGAFDVGIYLSTNNRYDDGVDVLVGARRITGLAAGMTSMAPTLVTIPANTAAGSYFLVVRADITGSSPQEVAEANEGNNTLATAALRVVRPDLAVLSVTAPGVTAPGANVSVSHVVKNLAVAVGRASASTSRLYLSPDATLDMGSDVVLGDVAVGALAGGTLATVPTKVTIPGGTAPGRYWIIAQANATNTVQEVDSPTQTNNVKATATPIIIGPDLIVTAATATPLAAAPGTHVNVTNTVRNQGGGAAAPFDVGIYLSTNNMYDSGVDLLLASRRVPTGLAAGAVSTATTPVTIPSNFSAGTYFLIVRADITGSAPQEVAEANEGNNTLATAAVQVVRPDLAMQTVTATPAALAPTGNISVTQVIRNVSLPAGPAPGTTSRLYLSDVPSPVVALTKPVIGDVAIPQIAGGAMVSVTKSLPLPPGTVPGKYWVYALANAVNPIEEGGLSPQGNNVQGTGTPILVGPDLTLTALTVPVSATPNLTIPIVSTVKNRGGQATNGSVVRLFLSQSGVLDGSEIPLGVTSTAALSPGGSFTATTRVTIPGNTSGGAKFVLAQADSGVPEADETNNISLKSVNIFPPNLQIVSITTPAAVIRGRVSGAPNISVVVKNNATPAISANSAPFNVQVFANRDDGTVTAKLPGGGDLIFTKTVAALAPGAMVTVTGPIVVPEGVSPDERLAGNYFVSATADPTGSATGDTSLGDNALTTATPKLPVLPDMTKLHNVMIDLLSLPAACQIPGNELHLRGTINFTSQSIANPSSFSGSVNLSDPGAEFSAMFTIAGTVRAVDGSRTPGAIASTFTYSGSGTSGRGTISGSAAGLDFSGGVITGHSASVPACTFSGTIDIVRGP